MAYVKLVNLLLNLRTCWHQALSYVSGARTPLLFSFVLFNHVLKDFVVYLFVNVADFLQKIVSNMTRKIFRP